MTSIKRRENKLTVFMGFAMLIKSLSTCSRLRVGSVITDERLMKVYSIGYNGSASGFPNRCDSMKPGSCGCIHSENNSLIKCGTSDQNKILFVTTLPCKQCAKLIINSGFSTVYYHEDYRDLSSLTYLKKANIIIEKL